MWRVLHLIQRLTQGGASRSLITMAKYSAAEGTFRHRVLSLVPAAAGAAEAAERAGMDITDAPGPGAVRRALEDADIVQVHFWNTPEMYELLRGDLPAMRLMVRLNVGGARAPQVLTEELIELADLVAVGSPHTLALPSCRSLEPQERERKLDLLIPAADFERLEGLVPRPHAGFNVGYIGTVDFIKMHPAYVRMSAGVPVPGVRFLVCGGGAAASTLRRQAERHGLADRLEIRGYVDDIRSVLEELDVFGYPLCEENYSTSESVLHEAMFAGVPPVIFDHGGARHTVEHGRTGLVVSSEEEYQQAIGWLFWHPEQRARLAGAARADARRRFGAANSVAQLHRIYRRMLDLPKRSRRWGRELPASGAERFVESLGCTAGAFRTSLFLGDVSEQIEADERIAASSPVLIHERAGGLVHYRNHYPNDPYLRLWTGLVLERRGQNVRALAEYRSAVELGCRSPRVFWHQARVGARLGARPLVVDSLRRVVEQAPEFEAARRMLGFWEEESDAQAS